MGKDWGVAPQPFAYIQSVMCLHKNVALGPALSWSSLLETKPWWYIHTHTNTHTYTHIYIYIYIYIYRERERERDGREGDVCMCNKISIYYPVWMILFASLKLQTSFSVLKKNILNFLTSEELFWISILLENLGNDIVFVFRFIIMNQGASLFIGKSSVL